MRWTRGTWAQQLLYQDEMMVELPAAVEAPKTDAVIPRQVVLRQCKYLNNVIEQDHRAVKKRVWLAKGYGTFQSAWRTLQGIETVHMIQKGE